MEQKTQPVVDSLVPVGFRVLLTMYQKDNITSSGFILPEQENKGLPILGQITILGKKTFWQKILILIGSKPRYKVGQWVYFKKYCADELTIESADEKLSLYVLEENEIIGLAQMI